MPASLLLGEALLDTYAPPWERTLAAALAVGGLALRVEQGLVRSHVSPERSRKSRPSK